MYSNTQYTHITNQVQKPTVKEVEGEQKIEPPKKEQASIQKAQDERYIKKT